MIEEKKPLGAVVLAAVLLLSAVFMPAAPGVGGVNSGNGSATPTATPVQGTVQEFSGQDRMNSVPDSHIKQLSNSRETETPPEPTDVRASAGSQTMQVETTTVDGDPALVLRDDQTHDGRWVSVSTKWLQEVHGEVPKSVTIEHESGETYTQQVRVEEDSAAFYVRGFSTNTVTFSGEVQINGNPAGDGTQYSYDIADLDSASNVTVNLTGVLNAEWDNATVSQQTGNTTLTSIGGNIEPTGPSANGNPVVTVQAWRVDNNEGGSGTSRYVYGDDSGSLIKSEMKFTDPPSTISQINVGVWSSPSNPDATVDIYIVEEAPDGTYGEGTLVKSGWAPAGGDSSNTVNISDYSVSTTGNITVEFVTTSSSTGMFSAAATTRSGTWSTSTVGTSKDRAIDTEIRGPAPNLSVSGDGGSSHDFGVFADGEQKSAELNLTVSAETVTVNGTGVHDSSIEVRERSQTQDPGVELNNGNYANHSGTLADGETVSLTIDESHISEGTNTVNVSVGDGTLSSDAPAPQVQLDYSHDAADRQSVDYAAEEWTSRYNVSKTFSSDRANATLTIPFDSSEVVSMRAVEYRVNESGGWSSMASSNYVLDGTTLQANLSDAYGGELPAGTTMEVRANASKIEVINGSVTVTQATTVDNELDTKIQVDSAGTNFRIGTANSEIHYAHNASYTSDTYWVADQKGQRIHLPNAAAGDTLRVSRLPVSVAPESGDVHVTVANTSTTEPAISVEPGQSTGNDVQFTFEDAKDDTEYALYSQTHDVVRDSGTANSPLTLLDDDSQETLKFLLSDDDGSGGGSSSSGGGGPMVGGDDGISLDLTLPLAILAAMLGFGGLLFIGRRFDFIDTTDRGDTVENAARNTATTLLGNEALVGGSLFSLAVGVWWYGIIPEETAIIAVVAAIPAGIYLGLREFGSGSPDIRVVGATSAMALVLGVEVIAPGTLGVAVEQLIGGLDPVLPLIVMGLLALGWRTVSAYQEDASTPDESNTVVIETNSGGDD